MSSNDKANRGVRNNIRLGVGGPPPLRTEELRACYRLQGVVLPILYQ